MSETLTNGVAPVARNMGKPVILAVDDKPELLMTIVHMLGYRYTVVAVTSAVAAMKAMIKHSPVLFLLDIEMPEMDGYELAALIRKHEEFKKTPIIFLTAKGTHDDVVTAVQNGGNDYIVKPVEKEVLLSKITRFLE